MGFGAKPHAGAGRYIFPDSLAPLRDWLIAKHVDVAALKSDRQALLFGQQLSGKRVRFPAKGASCFDALAKLQRELGFTRAGPHSGIIAAREVRFDLKHGTTGAASAVRHVDMAEHAARLGLPIAQAKSVENAKDRVSDSLVKINTPQGVKGEEVAKNAERNHPLFAGAIEIFTDGACEPNPGLGGWGFAVYRGAEEIHASCGGELDTTNNRMEMTGLLAALLWLDPTRPAIVWNDSRYVVDGANSWRHGWKKRGWKRGPEKPLANALLWETLDTLLDARVVDVRWTRGHVGTVGNERADELAEQGRQSVMEIAA